MSMITPGARGSGAVAIAVHDGRAARDPDQVDAATGLGQLLVRFQAASPLRVGDLITLPDSTRHPVTAVRDRMALDGSWSQTVTIGD